MSPSTVDAGGDGGLPDVVLYVCPGVMLVPAGGGVGAIILYLTLSHHLVALYLIPSPSFHVGTDEVGLSPTPIGAGTSEPISGGAGGFVSLQTDDGGGGGAGGGGGGGAG